MGVCLGNQLICRALGIEVSKKELAFQGTQEVIDFFGKKERVGFYNTFSGKFVAPIDGIDVAYNKKNKEIFGLRGKNFVSMQFHPESILTQNGLQILRGLLENLFTK